VGDRVVSDEEWVAKRVAAERRMAWAAGERRLGKEARGYAKLDEINARWRRSRGQRLVTCGWCGVDAPCSTLSDSGLCGDCAEKERGA
jgi:hypothetical protein